MANRKLEEMKVIMTTAEIFEPIFVSELVELIVDDTNLSLKNMQGFSLYKVIIILDFLIFTNYKIKKARKITDMSSFFCQSKPRTFFCEKCNVTFCIRSFK